MNTAKGSFSCSATLVATVFSTFVLTNGTLQAQMTEEEKAVLKEELKAEIREQMLIEGASSPVPAESKSEKSGIKSELKPYFNWDTDYYNQIRDQKNNVHTGQPFINLLGGITYRAWLRDNLILQFTPEFKSYTQLPMQPGFQDDLPSLTNSAYVDVAKVDWAIGETAQPTWRLNFGLQYYKDNPDTKIFGDYLIKSMIYPALPFTRPHRSDTRILGLNLNHHVNDMFNHNVIVHSNFQQYPFGDINLAYSAQANFANKFQIGAGAHWVSAIPFKPSRTTPRGGGHYLIGDNTYKEIPFQENKVVIRDTAILDAFGATIGRDTILNKTYSIIRLDSINPKGFAMGALVEVDNLAGGTPDTTPVELLNGKFAGLRGSRIPSNAGYENPTFSRLSDNEGFNIYPELNPNEERYSFSGQIFTLRLALNLLDGETFLGKDAFKLYTEAAILGWKNYPGMYENRKERVPVMLGINLPTFNYLEHLAFEVEWFGSKNIPTWSGRHYNAVPQPGHWNIADDYTSSWAYAKRYQKDDWKWGFQGRKNFSGFAISMQGGIDHTHSPTSTFNNPERYHDLMYLPYEWYMSTRLTIRL